MNEQVCERVSDLIQKKTTKKRVNKNYIKQLTFYVFITQFRVDATTYKHENDSY